MTVASAERSLGAGDGEARGRSRGRGVAGHRRRLVARAGLVGGVAASLTGMVLLLVPAGPPPGAVLLTLVGSATAVTSAAAMAWFLRRRGRRDDVRTAGEVEAVLGLPTLALVPDLGRAPDGPRPHQQLLDEPSSAYADAVDAALAALAARAAEGRPKPKVVLVTSSLPGEGKTTFAVSLATRAARTGKVLLIDLDLRQPNVHRELGRPPTAGLVEHLAEGRPLGEVVQSDPGTGLDFLPVGAAAAEEPTELVEGGGMARLLDAGRAGYDLVVLDTAPVGIITDTRIVARLADEVLFVVRWGMTGRAAASEGLRALRAAGAEPAGVVLTLVGPHDPTR